MGKVSRRATVLFTALATVSLLAACSSAPVGPSEAEQRALTYQDSAARVYTAVQETATANSISPKASISGTFTGKGGSVVITTEAAGDFTVELPAWGGTAFFTKASVTGTVGEEVVDYTYETSKVRTISLGGSVRTYVRDTTEHSELVTMNEAAFRAYENSKW
jgi:hypothetical protein